MSVSRLVDEYLKREDFDVLENANRYPGPSGLLAYVAEKSLWGLVKEVLSGDVLKAHTEGRIYIHKLPYAVVMPYCSGHSIERLLLRGLRTPSVTLPPASTFNMFVDHIVGYLTAMQHYFSGAQALSAVELYAGAFIRNENLDYGQVVEGVSRLVYGLNLPGRVGMQTPFTNLTVSLDVARRRLREARGIVGGDKLEPLESYLDEAVLFVRALYSVLGKGDALGRPLTFPIPTFMTTSKLLYEDTGLRETVFGAAAKLGVGYWLNTRIVDPDASFAMCCRINIDSRELVRVLRKSFRIRELRRELEEVREEFLKRLEKARGGGVWALPDVTGSKAVVTVNLPRLAAEARGDDAMFEENLHSILSLVRRALLHLAERYATLARVSPHFYSMVLDYLPEVFWMSGSPFFLTIGVIGLPEAAAIMQGEPRLWVEGSRRDWLRAAQWERKVVELIVDEARRWGLETGIAFNVEEVPGESAAARLASLDTRIYSWLSEYLPDPLNPVYSTSIAPYYVPMELWERVEVEEIVQPVFTGGVMMHIFLDEEPDPEALARLTRRLTWNTNLVYWSYTPAISVCAKCGWRGVGIHEKCPRCGSRTEVWSRIIGYYRPITNWNPARRAEFYTRIHYGLQGG